jgi:hypothetical protein
LSRGRKLQLFAASILQACEKVAFQTACVGIPATFGWFTYVFTCPLLCNGFDLARNAQLFENVQLRNGHLQICTKILARSIIEASIKIGSHARILLGIATLHGRALQLARGCVLGNTFGRADARQIGGWWIFATGGEDMAASVGDASLAVGVKTAFLLGKEWVAAAKTGASALANNWVILKQILVASTFHKVFRSFEQT